MPRRKNFKEFEKTVGGFEFSGIEFPVKLNDIDKFEKKNPGLAINVFGVEREEVYPLRLSKIKLKPINLLLISDSETNHYCLIKNVSRLLSSQISKKEHKKHFCFRCMNPFSSKEILKKHEEYCSKNEAVKIEMPEIGSEIKFKNFNRSLKVPFIVYADFECLMKPIHSCEPSPMESFTKEYQKHKPVSFSYCIICFDEDVFPQKIVEFTAKSEKTDVAQRFVKSLEKNIRETHKKFRKSAPQRYNFEEKKTF